LTIETIDSEIFSFMQKAQNLPKDELVRDLAELELEIAFLEAQLQAEPGTYSPRELQSGYGKVASFKQKADILRFELAK